jgi:hypothetical protein
MELNMNAELNKCPSPECHEDRILVAEDVKYLKKSYDELKGTVTEIKDKVADCLTQTGMRVFFGMTIVIFLAVIGVAINMYAETKDIPQIKTEVKAQDSRLTVVETNQKAVMKTTDKIVENQETIIKNLATLSAEIRDLRDQVRTLPSKTVITK